MRRLFLCLMVVASGCAQYVPVTPHVTPPVTVPITPPVVVPVIPNDGQRHWVVTDSLPDDGTPPVVVPPLTPVPGVQPSPFVPQPAETVCGCGCGKTGCQCGRMNAAAKECPGDTSPTLHVDDAALTSLGEQETVDIYAPLWCGNCPSWVAMWGQQSGRVRFNYIHDNAPPSLITAGTLYPLVTYRGEVLFRSPVGQTAASIAAAVQGKLQARGEMRAINVGTIRGKVSVASILDLLQDGGANTLIQFGGAVIRLPKEANFKVTGHRQEMRVTFAGQLPTVSYGSGWLSVQRPVTSLAVNREAVTLGIAGFPDVSLSLQP